MSSPIIVQLCPPHGKKQLECGIFIVKNREKPLMFPSKLLRFLGFPQDSNEKNIPRKYLLYNSHPFGSSHPLEKELSHFSCCSCLCLSWKFFWIPAPSWPILLIFGMPPTSPTLSHPCCFSGIVLSPALSCLYYFLGIPRVPILAGFRMSPPCPILVIF